MAYPLKVQLWGGTGPNSRQILLVDSDPISNTSWENHTFYFTTYDVSYSYVLLEVQWDTLTVQPRAYNGYTLIDNLGLDYVGPADTSIEHTIYYRGDNQMTLTPDNTGSRYQWFPEGNVADHSARSPIVTDYTETISVYVQQDNDCPILEIFHLILDCDTLYPERLVNTVDYYYRYEDSLILTASGGQTWSWEPQVHLSAYDIQSPRLLDFHELYTVTITDEYGCEFQENFNIILHCDTLYPGGTLVVIDTVLTEVADFVLEPRYGIHISEWTPTLYMSCMDCVYPMVTPISTITYSVELIDDFECIHTELFRFEVMLIIPNVITPNDDGYNDCFNVLGLPPNTTFRLFDKTGRSIVTVESYETVDCWAGTDNAGRPLGSGTYWYAFEDASSHTLAKGFLFIKR